MRKCENCGTILDAAEVCDCRKITAVVKEAGKPAEIVKIENTLESLRRIVGGHIEVIHVLNDIVMVCNEEGKLEDLRPNIAMPNDVIVGTVIALGTEGDEFRGLTDEESIFMRDYIDMEGMML